MIRVNEEEEMGELPECLTFFEMYGIHTLEELKVAERWKAHRTEQSLKAVIGQKAGCKDCILDVDMEEKIILVHMLKGLVD